MENEIPTSEPYQDFLFAINSPVTRERYSTRLRSFFVSIGIEGTTMEEERCRKFVEKVKESEENGIGSIDALNNGFHLAFITAAIVAAIAAIVAFVVIKKLNASGEKEKEAVVVLAPSG